MQAVSKRFEGEAGVVSSPGVMTWLQKFKRTAEASGVSPQGPTAIRGQRNVREALANAGRSATIRFIRTTDPRHRQIVRAVLPTGEASGDCGGRRQQGWYCVCLRRVSGLMPSGRGSGVLDSPRPLWRGAMSSTVFPPVGVYQAQIEALVSQPASSHQPGRAARWRNFRGQGLRDFSISRLHLPWGDPRSGPCRFTLFYVCVRCLAGVHHGLLRPGDPADRISPSPAVGQPLSNVSARTSLGASMPFLLGPPSALGGPEPPRPRPPPPPPPPPCRRPSKVYWPWLP